MAKDANDTKDKIKDAHEAVQVAVGRWLADEGLLDTLPDHKKAELILKITKESFLSQALEEQITHLINMLEGGKDWVRISKEMTILRTRLAQAELQNSILEADHQELVRQLREEKFDASLFWAILKESVEDLTAFHSDVQAVMEYLEINEQEFCSQLEEIAERGSWTRGKTNV